MRPISTSDGFAVAVASWPTLTSISRLFAGRRAWWWLTALAAPLSVWWLTLIASGRTGPVGYAILLLPVLLLARGLSSRPTVTSVLAGVIIALCFIGIVGSGVAYVPFGLATIFFEARDLRRRSAPVLWGTLLTAAAFVLTFAGLIAASTSFYASR